MHFSVLTSQQQPLQHHTRTRLRGVPVKHNQHQLHHLMLKSGYILKQLTDGDIRNRMHDQCQLLQQHNDNCQVDRLLATPQNLA